jgi:predicted DNA-binding transcriptional regulator AlpA
MTRNCVPPPPKLMYSIPEACCLAGIGRSLLYVILAQGKGPVTVKIGNRTLIQHDKLVEWRKGRAA